MSRRLYIRHLPFATIALLIAVLLTRTTVQQPGYTDAYYYYNAAERLASGDGLTDAYLWTYIGAPEQLPDSGVFPSHLYWMPFTSMVAGFGMWIFDAPGNYAAAQLPFALLLAGAAGIAYWLGGYFGGTARHRWVAGLLTLFSAFFSRFWGMTDSFTPYAFVGALSLVYIGLGLSDGIRPNAPETAQRPVRLRTIALYWFLAGIFAGLGHLTRADGLLLLLVGILMIVVRQVFRRDTLVLYSVLYLGMIIAGYLLVMTPWFIRSIDATGAPLPIGGTDAIWYTEYDDLFNFPPGAEPDDLLGDGFGLLFESRWQAFTNNLGTFIAVQGMIILTPLMLIGLWVRRGLPMLWGFGIYALGLHVAMTFVFSFPGFRGGLFHSAAALIPWWAALSVIGLDDVVAWLAARRRNWKPKQAQWVFSIGIVLMAATLTYNVATANRVLTGTPNFFTQIAEALPENARVMINDPAQLYYFTGLGGVVIPNASPDVIPEIATRYNVTHLLVETYSGAQAVPAAFAFDLDNPPAFLIPLDVQINGATIYEIAVDTPD